MSPNGVSIRPSDFVEGGVVPVDKDLTWKECRFANFDYQRKDGSIAASTIAARITYLDDEGVEYIQHYSAGDPARFQPSADGKTLVSVTGAGALAKSSNYYLLMNALINAGFPEDKLGEDISVLDGLKTHNIGIPEPKRVGLKKDITENARERVISVPSEIIHLPGEKVKGGKTAAPKAGSKAGAPTAGSEPSAELSADAIAIVSELLADAESVTKQEVATKAVRSKKNAVAQFVFKKEFGDVLLANGYLIDGDTISKVE